MVMTYHDLHAKTFFLLVGNVEMLEIMFETIGLARKKTQQSKSPQPWVPQKVVPSHQHKVVGAQSLQRILLTQLPWKMLPMEDVDQ